MIEPLLRRWSFLIVLLALVAAACTPNTTPLAPVRTLAPASPAPAETPGGSSSETGDRLSIDAPGFFWWNDTVFYEIFVRSFYDSDGDGVGDFQGVIARLDHLNDGDPRTSTDLGVTGIWLMPIFPATSYHGYDVLDYYAVNPEYGTMEDFEQLLSEAHRRGINVIIDLVLNHTSVEHPWFQQALDPGSPYRDWYLWSEEDITTPGPWGQQVWHASPAGDYYYGVFWEGMPDLNYENPDVDAEMRSVIRFWLEEVGVDGFRLDGTRYYVEEDGELADTPANHEWLRDFRTFYKSINPEALTVAEVWTNGFVVRSYLKGDQVDLAFDFDLASAFLNSAGSQRADSALNQLKFSIQGIPEGQFAPFLTNHDIDRVMSQLGGNVQAARHAATLLLTAPGVPFLYYGEEIGMRGQKPDEKIRTPMQWSAEENAGFTTGTPWQPLNEGYEDVNVTTQADDPDSLFSFYRRLIHLRNASPALRVGKTEILESADPAVYAILRVAEGQTILVVVNLSDESVSEYGLELRKSDLRGSYAAVDLLRGDLFEELAVDDNGGISGYQPLPELPPHTTLILELRTVP